MGFKTLFIFFGVFLYRFTLELFLMVLMTITYRRNDESLWLLLTFPSVKQPHRSNSACEYRKL